MSVKIKLIAGGALLLLAGLAAWYVQGLRADNARLSNELAINNIVVAAQAVNLAKLYKVGKVVEMNQSQATEKINALNKELQDATRRPGANYAANNQINNSPRAAVVAEQLNRLFECAAPTSGH